MGYYFDKNTDVKSSEITTKCIIGSNLYTFKTDNNVFSKRGLDFGTRTLLETIDKENINGSVLDFGCGYGPIGIYIKKETNAIVDMIDINERAIALARINASINRADVNIFSSNIYENVNKKYDFIITNPPIRVGKNILYKILIGAKDYLKQHGHLIFVINKDQGAKSVVKGLSKYYEVNILKKNKGFYVIDCKTY